MANKTLYIKNSFTFNGKCSRDYGLVVTKFPDPIRPKRKGEAHDIPNRSGRIVDESDEYENYTQPYVCKLIATDGRGPGYAARALADWLLTSKGYCRLEDDAEPDVYRLARFSGPLDIASISDDTAEVTLEFDCQPKRYFKSGEESFTIGYDATAKSSTLSVAFRENWTLKPIGLIVYGTVKSGKTLPSKIGTFTSGSNSFDFGASSSREVPSGTLFESYICYTGGAGEVKLFFPNDTFTSVTVYYSDDIGDFEFSQSSQSNHDRMPNAVVVGYFWQNQFRLTNPTKYASAPEYDITADDGAQCTLTIQNDSEHLIFGSSKRTVNVVGKSRVRTIIDAETYAIYYTGGAGNASSSASFSGAGQYQEIPKLTPGNNWLTASSTGTFVIKITPRWWTL